MVAQWKFITPRKLSQHLRPHPTQIQRDFPQAAHLSLYRWGMRIIEYCIYHILCIVYHILFIQIWQMVLWPGSSGIKNFQSRDFRDGILHNPRIPGLFGTGLAWNFYPRISSKKYGYGQISQTICLQMENFVVAILYLAYLALKYMYFEDLWIKVADFRKWGRYVQYVVLIIGNLWIWCEHCALREEDGM